MPDKRKIVLFIATSLDGYIATEDDSLEWLFKVEGKGDNGYSEFYSTVDTILMGRRTYDWIIENEQGAFPYKNKKCYVFSKSEHEKNDDVAFVDPDVAQFANELKSQDGGNIWLVGGGSLIQAFMKEKLVDEMIITIAPTIIGSGIPLFHKNDSGLELNLTGMRRFNQFAELRYEVKQSANMKEAKVEDQC